MPNDLPDYTQAIARPSQQLAGSPWTYGSTGGTKTFPLDTDCHSVGLALTDPSHVLQIIISGTTTGVDYLSSLTITGNLTSFLLFPVTTALDSTIQVALGATRSGTLYLTEVFDPQATSASINPAQNAVEISLLGPSALLNTGNAPWMAPNREPAAFDTGNLASGSSFVLLAASAFTYYLFGVSIWPLNAGAIWHLQDTAGTDIGSYLILQLGTATNDFAPIPPDLNFHGAPLPLGLGLQLKNTSGSTQRWVGHVVYSVG